MDFLATIADDQLYVGLLGILMTSTSEVRFTLNNGLPRLRLGCPFCATHTRTFVAR